jgi:hypothetical protein
METKKPVSNQKLDVTIIFPASRTSTAADALVLLIRIALWVGQNFRFSRRRWYDIKSALGGPWTHNVGVVQLPDAPPRHIQGQARIRESPRARP